MNNHQRSTTALHKMRFLFLTFLLKQHLFHDICYCGLIIYIHRKHSLHTAFYHTERSLSFSYNIVNVKGGNKLRDLHTHIGKVTSYIHEASYFMCFSIYFNIMLTYRLEQQCLASIYIFEDIYLLTTPPQRMLRAIGKCILVSH